MKVTKAQLDFLRFLVKTERVFHRPPMSARPWGTRDAGRRAANWDRTVGVLERLGLVTATERNATLIQPAPAFVYEVDG